MKIGTLVGYAGILALALALAAGPANATQRDVIGDAAGICAPGSSSANLQAACDLVFKTNGKEILKPAAGCLVDLGNGDNGFVEYLLRNCDQNETALLRRSASAVLSLNDFVNKGKTDQAATAAGYLCTYAGSYMTLQGAGKLVAAVGVDLAADAQDIAAALGFSCP